MNREIEMLDQEIATTTSMRERNASSFLHWTLVAMCFALVGSLAQAGEVKLFMTPGAVKKPYTELGLVTADEGDSLLGMSEKELMESLKKQAAAMGADAVILLSTQEGSDIIMNVGDQQFVVGGTTMKGVAIKYE